LISAAPCLTTRALVRPGSPDTEVPPGESRRLRAADPDITARTEGPWAARLPLGGCDPARVLGRA
jgi:hypothetical protein